MNGWQRTIEELHALESRLRSEGWETVATQAGDASFVPIGVGDDDWFGLSLTVPGDDADRIERVVGRATLDEYDVFRRATDGRTYLVIRYADADARVAVLVAATYDRQGAAPRTVARSAADRGTLHTRLRRLDGTPVAEFTHEDHEPFFPGTGGD